MYVGKRKETKIQEVYQQRSQRSIQHAISEIRKSPICPYVKTVYLYGSCARKSQNYNSDVDLFLILNDEVDAEEIRDDIYILKSKVSPGDLSLPEVDLKVVVGDQWKQNHMLYFQNIRKEGIPIWEKEPILT